MALKRDVPGGTTYDVAFKSSSQTVGATLLTVGWVPYQQRAVPGSQDIAIAPGTTGQLGGQVPPTTNVRRIEIRVDLPDGRGWGTLTLKVNGAVHAEGQLGEDATWTSIVI